MIPKIIHLTWKHSGLTGQLKACVDSFRIWNPDWDIRFYTDVDCEEFVYEYFPEFVQTYFAYPPGIFRADIFRVLALRACGGVYADIDIECRQPLDVLFEQFATGEFDILLTRDHPIHERQLFAGRKIFMNDFFAAPPNSRFLSLVLEKMEKKGAEIRDRQPQQAVFETGPVLFTEVVEEEFLRTLQGEDTSKIRYVPWQRIHPIPDMSNKFPEKEEWERQILNRDWQDEYDPFVVHYWYHTWCRQGNTLIDYGHFLLQSEGEIVESRLQKFLPRLGERADTVGIALSQFAEEGCCDLIELGATRSFVSATREGFKKPDRQYWNPAEPSGWDWDGGFFTRVASEVLQGLPVKYYGVDPDRTSLKISGAVTEDLSNIDFSFTLLATTEFLRNYEGQAGLIYFGHGDADEDSARIHESDAKLVVQRELVRPGGYVLIDDHRPDGEQAIPKSKYSKAIFESAGFKKVEEGHQLLLYRPNFPIPAILHFFSDPDASGPMDGELSSWRKLDHIRDWSFEHWSLEKIWEVILEFYPEFAPVWEAYDDDSDRISAGRYLILKRYGGVCVTSSLAPSDAPDLFLEGRELVFLGTSQISRLSSKRDAVSDSFMASIPDHRFWDGIVDHLASVSFAKIPQRRHGSEFLTQRVKNSNSYLPKEERATVLGGLEHILS